MTAHSTISSRLTHQFEICLKVPAYCRVCAAKWLNIAVRIVLTGVCWIQVYFTVNLGRKFRDSSWCPLDRDVCSIWGPHNTGFTLVFWQCNLIESVLLSVPFYLGRLGGLKVSGLFSGLSGLGSCPGLGHVLCPCTHFTLALSLSIQVYEWVLAIWYDPVMDLYPITGESKN